MAETEGGSGSALEPPSRRLWARLRQPGRSRTPADDRWSLSDLVQTYALAVDDGDLETVVDMFTPAGEFVRAGARVRGAEELGAFFQSMMRGYRTTTHVPQASVVVLEGDRASGVSTGSAELVSLDGTLRIATYRYDDEYVRERGVWRFRRRALTFHDVLPAAERATALGERRRIRRGSEEGVEADYPETFRTWQRWHVSE